MASPVSRRLAASPVGSLSAVLMEKGQTAAWHESKPHALESDDSKKLQFKAALFAPAKKVVIAALCTFTMLFLLNAVHRWRSEQENASPLNYYVSAADTDATVVAKADTSVVGTPASTVTFPTF